MNGTKIQRKYLTIAELRYLIGCYRAAMEQTNKAMINNGTCIEWEKKCLEEKRKSDILRAGGNPYRD